MQQTSVRIRGRAPLTVHDSTPPPPIPQGGGGQVCLPRRFHSPPQWQRTPPLNCKPSSKTHPALKVACSQQYMELLQLGATLRALWKVVQHHSNETDSGKREAIGPPSKLYNVLWIFPKEIEDRNPVNGNLYVSLVPPHSHESLTAWHSGLACNLSVYVVADTRQV